MVFPFALQREDLVSRTAKDAREGESQHQAWHIAVALNRVDALPRNTDGFAKLLLRPSASVAQLLNSTEYLGHM